jgi:hypothetical protein
MPKFNNNIVPIDSAEMYYNSNRSCSYSYSYSTLQQSTDPRGPTDESVGAPEAPSSPNPSGYPSGRKDQGIPGLGSVRKNIPKKVSTEHIYTQINASINEIRRGTRTDRMNLYLSLMEENDKKFSIYLRSSLTTSNDETYRSLKKTDNRILLKELEDMMANCPNSSKLFTGRLRYNPRRFKIEDEHRTNLKSGLVSVYDHGKSMTVILFLLGEYYVIEMSDDLTKKQKSIFDLTGSWKREIPEEL